MEMGSRGYQLLSPWSQTLKASHLHLHLRRDKTLPKGHLAKVKTANDESSLPTEFTVLEQNKKSCLKLGGFQSDVQGPRGGHRIILRGTEEKQ